ncbi:MAG: DUF2283 domain-containing protein [Nitrospira sp.]|nr:DUF2283 domain-containing protein [Nitrospira sp.]
MKIEYDKAADAMYIRLHEGEFQCRNVRLTDDIALDFAVGEQLIGIELLGASRLFEKPESPLIELKDLIPKVIAA